jgi:tRNA G37 N-methylase Trm5
MNLPEKALEFVDVACRAVKPEGGVIHFYGFVRLPDSLENMKSRFSEAVEKVVRMRWSGELGDKNIAAALRACTSITA